MHQQNNGENGRIVINKGRNEIFSLHFLHYNDTCKVNMLCPDGKKRNINGEERVLFLEIPNPTDYMSIVSYYAGDC